MAPTAPRAVSNGVGGGSRHANGGALFGCLIHRLLDALDHGGVALEPCGMRQREQPYAALAGQSHGDARGAQSRRHFVGDRHRRGIRAVVFVGDGDDIERRRGAGDALLLAAHAVAHRLRLEPADAPVQATQRRLDFGLGPRQQIQYDCANRSVGVGQERVGDVHADGAALVRRAVHDGRAGLDALLSDGAQVGKVLRRIRPDRDWLERLTLARQQQHGASYPRQGAALQCKPASAKRLSGTSRSESSPKTRVRIQLPGKLLEAGKFEVHAGLRPPRISSACRSVARVR
jgi:hypothetical protein